MSKNHNRKPHERTASSKAMLAYRAALDRLLCGKPTHPAFANRPIRITPASVAREAGRSRNPLYSTHRSFLIEIQAAANQRSVAGDLSSQISELEDANKELRRAIRRLRTDKRNLATENLALLHRARVAEAKLRPAPPRALPVLLDRA